jgi:hypothetical protein
VKLSGIIRESSWLNLGVSMGKYSEQQNRGIWQVNCRNKSLMHLKAKSRRDLLLEDGRE